MCAAAGEEREGRRKDTSDVPNDRGLPLEIGDDVLESGYVQKVADRLAGQGVKAEWDIVHDRHVADAIVRFTQAHEPALLTLTTHGHSGLGRLTLGGVAFQVVHRATCPVLVLRPADLGDA